jgi:hypothetical protein
MWEVGSEGAEARSKKLEVGIEREQQNPDRRVTCKNAGLRYCNETQAGVFFITEKYLKGGGKEAI